MTTVCGARRCNQSATSGGLCRDHAEAHQHRQAVRMLRGSQ